MTRKQNIQDWAKIIDDWKKSDQTRTAFCSSQQIKLSTFDYWRKKLATKTPAKDSINPKLVRVPVSLGMQSQECRLIINGRHILEFPQTISPESLKRIILTVKAIL